MIQIGGVYTTFCQEEGILWQKYAIEMGDVSRYFSKVSGSGVDLTLLKKTSPEKSMSDLQCCSAKWYVPLRGLWCLCFFQAPMSREEDI